MDDVVLESASQIAVPALVSTLSICIVFAPMFLLTGVARYLFVPLAEAVVFAMLASYLPGRKYRGIGRAGERKHHHAAPRSKRSLGGGSIGTGHPL